MLPPGPYPYPAFCPPYMPPPGPGGPMQPPPGMPHGPHPMMYGGEGAHLAPYPPGMPVPLPPEVAAELAAAAGPAQPGAPAAPGRKPAAAAAAAPDSRVEPAEGAAEAQQPDVPSSGGESRAAAGPAGFLALLQRSCGGVQLILPGSGQRRRRQGFDAAATAAEFERRWQAAAPTAVPACSLEPAAEQWPAAAAAPQPPSRSSSGSLSSKGTPSVAAKRAPSGSCSGRSSPAGGAPGGKPVVVAVRAWTTDDSADDGHVGKWRIQTANPSAEHQAQQAQAQQA